VKVSITLAPGESIQEADDNLVKAITSKYDRSKLPHPDPAVDEVSYLFRQEYNKMIVEMMEDILRILESETGI